MMKTKNKGYSLVEILIVLSIIVALSALALQKLKSDAEKVQAEGAGQEIVNVTDWLVLYMKRNVNTLQGQIDPNCIPVSGTPLVCRLDLRALVVQGFAPVGWEAYSPMVKSNYTAYVRLLPPVTALQNVQEYNLQAYVQTDNAWLVGGSGTKVDTALVGAAARAAGSVGGVTNGAGASGTNGNWTLAAGSFPGMGQGQLVGLAQVQAQALGSYLNLAGTRPLTGDLELNGFRLNNTQDIMINANNMKRRQVSTMMPTWVFKGAYGVSDYDVDAAGGSVPIPVCPDSGVPKVLVSMQALYNERFGGYSSGIAAADPSQAATNMSGAYGAWNFYALQDTSAGIWRTYIRRFYDNGYIPGEGIASVYCYYP